MRDTSVNAFLQRLGIDPTAAKIYLLLLERNNPSVLQLSKDLQISRTQVESRMLQLRQAGLVDAKRGQYGLRYKALPFENVEGLIAAKEAETRLLRDQFGAISESVQKLAGRVKHNSDTRHYHGTDGLKQVNWNLCNADKEYRVIEMARIPQLFGPAFVARCRERMIERKLLSYNLTNDAHVPVSELEPLDPGITHYRHIDSRTFSIEFEIFLFDGVITLVDNRPEVLEAIEIRNTPFYTMMRQMYDTMWGLGEPLTVSPA